MTRTILLTRTVAVLLTAVIFATVTFAETTKETKPTWTFTEEQLRLFHPPLDADAEKMLDWTGSLESPIPRDTEKWGGHDKYREHVQRMRIMVSRAILAIDPPLELEKHAWGNLFFPYSRLSKQNQSEWLPKMKAMYDELTALSRKNGEVLDQQTAAYISLRGSFFLYISGMEKNFLSQADELIGEIDNWMKKHRELDNLMSDIYGAKSLVLRTMSDVDEKYKQQQADLKTEMKELVLQNEDRLQSSFWFHLLYPEDPYDTPEKQAEVYRLIEKFQKLIDTNEETKRFDADSVKRLYYHQITLFSSLVFSDKTNISKLQAYLDAIEKKNDPQLISVLYGGYRNLWTAKSYYFGLNGGSNDDLAQIFDGMEKFLAVAADNFYDNAGHWLSGIARTSPPPLAKCTPEQQELFKNRLAQLITKMEVVEKAWKDAGKPMDDESYTQLLQSYLDFLRMPGTVVALTGQTVDGTPFDIKQYRGKVVVLHFWATWCGPCIRQIPFMKELYTQYHDRGFEVLGISYDFEPEKIQPFIDKYELPYLSLFDKDWKILNRFSHDNSSLSCLIDREGKAVFYKTDEELREKLKELFPAE